MTVEYDEKDNLCHLSEFILDLDPQCKTVNLLFECSIKKDKMLEGIKTRGKMPLDKYVTNHIKDCLERKVYTFNSIDDLKTENRYKLIEKELKDVEKLIVFEIIHAKRSVASSEEKNGAKKDRTPEEDDMLDMMRCGGQRVKIENLSAVLDWYNAQQ